MSSAGAAAPSDSRTQPKILTQSFFKSVGPRTYAAQVKEAGNGNHFLVLTEGKRDEKTGDVRKTRLFVFSEDFPAFFRMLHETAQFIRANPVSEEVKARRQRFWEKQSAAAGAGSQGDQRSGGGAQARPGRGAQPEKGRAAQPERGRGSAGRSFQPRGAARAKAAPR
jgi:hypothetical protein